MTTTVRSKRYQCAFDCQMTGCPGHDLTVSWHHTSSTVSVAIDGKELFVLEDGGLHALLEVIQWRRTEWANEVPL